jgi:hypothetical protein
MQHKINTLLKLEEKREYAKKNLAQHQELEKCRFDINSISSKELQEGDLVLKWDKSKGKHSKFQQLWINPYIIHEKIVSRTFKLKTLKRKVEEILVNG